MTPENQNAPMNEPTLIELRIDTTALGPEEQAIFGLFTELPPAKLVQCLRVLHHWEQAPASQRALALKLLDGRLPDKLVARLCGLSDRQLRRYPEYQRFARALRHQRRARPRGSKDSEGRLEAWDAED